METGKVTLEVAFRYGAEHIFLASLQKWLCKIPTAVQEEQPMRQKTQRKPLYQISERTWN